MALSLSLIILYLILIFYVTWIFRKKDSGDGFIIGNRKVGFLGTSLSQLVSLTDGTGLVILMMLAVIFGYGSLWGLAGITVGASILALLARRIRKLAGTYHYVTISDMLRHRIGPKTEFISALLIIFATLMAIAGQLHISGKILGEFINIPEPLGVALIAIVVGGYLWIGGYMTVVMTDVMQGLMIVLFCLMSFIIFSVPTMETVSSEFLSINNKTGWGFFLFVMVVTFTYFSSWERIFSAKTEEIAAQASYMNVFLNFLLNGAVFAFGISVHNMFPDIPADRIVYDLFGNKEVMYGTGALLGVMALALIMSSLDSRAYTVSANLTSNIFKVDFRNHRLRFIKYLRLTVLVIFISLSLVAIFIPDFVQFMINVGSMYGFFASVFVVAVLYAPRFPGFFDVAMTTNILVGAILWSYMFLSGFFEGFMPNMIPIGVVTVMCFLTAIFDRFICHQRLQN